MAEVGASDAAEQRILAELCGQQHEALEGVSHVLRVLLGEESEPAQTVEKVLALWPNGPTKEEMRDEQDN